MSLPGQLPGCQRQGCQTTFSGELSSHGRIIFTDTMNSPLLSRETTLSNLLMPLRLGADGWLQSSAMTKGRYHWRTLSQLSFPAALG